MKTFLRIFMRTLYVPLLRNSATGFSGAGYSVADYFHNSKGTFKSSFQELYSKYCLTYFTDVSK